MKFFKFLRGLVKFLTAAVILGMAGFACWKFIDYRWVHPETYAAASAPWYRPLILWGIAALLCVIVLTILNFILRVKIKEMNGGTYPNRPNGRNMENILWHDRKRNGLGLPWSFTKYSVDEDRLFVQTGLFSSKEDEIRLYRITDLTLQRSFWQKIIGVGTIHCDAGDATMPHFDLKNVKNAKKVKDMLSDLVHRTHTAEPIPFCIYYPGIHPDSVQTFDEDACRAGAYGLLEGDEFIKLLMDGEQG